MPDREGRAPPPFVGKGWEGGSPPHEQRGIVLAVHRSPTHSFSKKPALSIRLIAGLGVEGDAHAGETVRHRSRVARNPTQPNLRQVHLIHSELHDELNAANDV